MSVPPKLVLPVFLLVFLAGAVVLGPLLYYILAGHVVFHRVMDRALLISALGALVLFWKRIPFREYWPLNRNAGISLLVGYILAFVSVQAMIGFNVAANGFERIPLSGLELAMRILLALIPALLIPPLEETLFRGFLQGELIRSLGWRAGWIMAAAIFSLSHFLKIPSVIDGEPVYLWSGVTALMHAFEPLAHGDFLSGRGLNLFLVGLILGALVLRSGSLWASAGLHSGWIFVLLLYPRLAKPGPHPFYTWLQGDLLSSPITSMVLVLLGFWIWRFYKHPSIVPETGDNAP